MAWAILDSNVYVGHWQRGLYASDLAMIRRKFVIRHSAIVLSELRRGVRTGEALTIVEGLYQVAHVQWEPAADDWWQAGRLIREIGDEQTWDRNKRRDFQNDALIALTAHRYGATVITANRKDFEWLARELDIRILVVRTDPADPTQRLCISFMTAWRFWRATAYLPLEGNAICRNSTCIGCRGASSRERELS